MLSRYGIYVKKEKESSVIWISMCVNDLLVTENDHNDIECFKALMVTEF